MNWLKRLSNFWRLRPRTELYFEGKYRHARKKHGCSPWFLPGCCVPGERHCGAAEVVRFQASMAEFRREHRTPHCLENCDEVEFDVFGTVVN